MTVGMNYTMPLIVILTTLAGCSVVAKNPTVKWFNDEEFIGLEGLGSSYKSVRLAYDLDGTNGERIVFYGCDDVDHTEGSDVVESQFPLYRKIYINCLGAKYYHKGSEAETSFLPDEFGMSLIEQLPASVVPNRGGSSLEPESGSLLRSRQSLDVVKTSEKAFTIRLEGTEIDYVLLASADVNNDGLQDWVVRLDWSDTESFGEGTDLVVLTQRSDSGDIEVVSRYPEP